MKFTRVYKWLHLSFLSLANCCKIWFLYELINFKKKKWTPPCVWGGPPLWGEEFPWSLPVCCRRGTQPWFVIDSYDSDCRELVAFSTTVFSESMERWKLYFVLLLVAISYPSISSPLVAWLTVLGVGCISSGINGGAFQKGKLWTLSEERSHSST